MLFPVKQGTIGMTFMPFEYLEIGVFKADQL